MTVASRFLGMRADLTSLERLLAEEPFIRSLARQLVAGDADDIVQQAYLQAIECGPDTLDRPRSWLARVVRNLAIDHGRRGQRRDDRQRVAAVRERVPTPAELLASEQCRRAVVAELNRLSPQLRTVVLLRYYEGLPPRRIAKELNLTVSTVSEQLRSALKQLRARLDNEHDGDRRAWLVPLLPFATKLPAFAKRALMPTSAAALISGVIMTVKSKIVAVVAVLLVLLGIWTFWSSFAGQEPTPATGGASGAVAAKMAGQNGETAEPLARQERKPAVLEPSPMVPTGSLIVTVYYAADAAPVAGLTVSLVRPDGEFRVGVQRAPTDAAGSVAFAAVPPGHWDVRTGRAHGSKSIEVRAGERIECNLELKGGITVRGIVIDKSGAPVSGALIEAGEPRAEDPEVVAISGADGTFELREFPFAIMLGARAAGHAASSLQSVHGQDESRVVRLELVASGGMVEGVVLDPAGAPVTNAVIRIGNGQSDNLTPFTQGGAPLPAQVRTGALGRFHAVGIPSGSQPVQVRAVGFAPWSGTCEVMTFATTPVRLFLTPGATCTGTVRTSDGAAVADATVRVGAKGEFVQLFAHTDSDGHFTMRDLPAGDVELSVSDREHGKAAALVQASAGAMVRCELTLSNGVELRGQVLDASGKAVPTLTLNVVAAGEGTPWRSSSYTDGQGRFRVRFCPEGRLLSVAIDNGTFVALRQTGIDPRAGDLTLRVQRVHKSVRIIGMVVDPDGNPLGNISVDGNRSPAGRGRSGAATSVDGDFELGPLRAGRWGIRILTDGYAEYRSKTFTLEENATVDVGTIRMHKGGNLLARITGAEPSGLDLLLYNDNSEFVGSILSTIAPLRSSPLNPGQYRLQVRGQGFAAQTVPFSIRDGEETELDVSMVRATNQRFEFRARTGTELPRRVRFEVRRGDDLVVVSIARAATDGLTCNEWLAPADYSLVVITAGVKGSAQFTVANKAAADVVVSLR